MSQRSMVPLLIFAAIVLAAGAGLWLTMRGGDDAVAPPGAPSTATVPPPPLATDHAPSAPTVTPSLPGETRTPAAAGEVNEYVVGDTRIRDHGGGSSAPVDIPPGVHPAEARRLTSNLVHEVGTKLKTIVKECAVGIPAAARGKDPHLEGLVQVAIKAKQVTVTKAVVQLRDVTDASVDSIKKCIEEKALTLTQPADETDLASYDINVSYAL